MQKPKRGLLKAPWRWVRSGLRADLPRRLRSGPRGQGMVEYALMLMLVALVLIVILTVLGGRVTDMYSNVSHGIK